MTPSDDILDLLGRYATGSLSERERQRLFDAALNDQELFEELAREQELKMLLEQPGARSRMIRALEPKRKMPWILPAALAAALSVVLIVFLMRPKPAPASQVAILRPPAATPSAIPPAVPAPPPQVARAKPLEKKKAVAAEQPVLDQPSKDVAKQEAVEVQPPPAAPRAMSGFLPQQRTAGGPRQMAAQGQAAASTSAPFGFHYSVETKGHLIIVPGADGYLFVKSNDGTVLFDRKQIAAAITTDIAVPASAASVTITFSQDETPVETTPTVHSEPGGTIAGTTGLAVQVQLK